MTRNVLIVGVGGQGSLLASRILGNYFMEQGLEVMVSEVHGMSQRGGSVVTYVRAGEKVVSSLIPKGEADIIVSFEELEAIRWHEYLKPNGDIVVNTQKIWPMPVITGAADYPEKIIEKMEATGANVHALDALSLALEAGSVRCTNVVMLGAMSKIYGGDIAHWHNALKKAVKPKLLDMNMTAFEKGRNLVK